MADNSELQIKIVLDDGQVVQGFVNVQNAANRAAKKTEESFTTSTENIKSALGEISPNLVGSLESIGSKITSILSNPFVALGASVAALGFGFKKAFDLSLEGEKLLKIEKTFDTLATKEGLVGNVLKSKLEEVANGAIDTSSLLKIANESLITLGAGAQRLPELLRISIASVKIFGGTAEEALDKLNTAISFGNTKAFKQLGLTIDTEKAYKDYARTLNLSAGDLNQAQRQQALLTAAIEAGNKQFKDSATGAVSQAIAIKQVGVALQETNEQFSIFINKNYGSFFADVTSKFASFLKEVNGNTTKSDKLRELSEEIEKVQNRVNKLNFAKFEREGQTGFASFFQVFKDGEGPVANVTLNLIRSKEQLEELRAQFKALSQEQKSASQNSIVGDSSIGSKSIGLTPEQLIINKTKILEASKFRLDAQKSELDGEISLTEQIKSPLQKRALLISEYAEQISLIQTQAINQQKLIEAQNQDTSALGLKIVEDNKLAIQAASNAQQIQLQVKHKEELKNINDNADFETLNGFQKVSGAFSLISKGATEEAKRFSLSAGNSFKELGKQAVNTIGTGIGRAFAAFGQALAKGEDAGKAFLESTLKLFGDLAVNIGSYFVALGLAKLFATPEEQAEALPLISAGAALAVLGGLLGASGGGAAASGSSSGGGVASSPSLATDNTQPSQLQRTDPQTKVQVVVQGSIYDSSETGSRIVDLINSAFNEKGVVVQRGVIA